MHNHNIDVYIYIYLSSAPRSMRYITSYYHYYIIEYQRMCDKFVMQCAFISKRNHWHWLQHDVLYACSRLNYAYDVR